MVATKKIEPLLKKNKVRESLLATFVHTSFPFLYFFLLWQADPIATLNQKELFQETELRKSPPQPHFH